MPQENKARTMRKAFQAKIAHLPYAEQRQLTEMLRDMSNERNSRLAQEGRRAGYNANPVGTNPLSEAVNMRGQEPPQAPKLSHLRDIRSTPSQPPVKSISERLAEQSKSRRIENMSQAYSDELTSRPAALRTEKLANDAAYGAESRLGRMGGQVAGVADRAMENALVRGGVRTIGKALPILGDLLLPYGSIDGGDMYTQAGDPSRFVNTSGANYLPPHLQAANDQWQQQDQYLRQRQDGLTRNYVDQNFGRSFAPVQMPMQQQQMQEPSSIASMLSRQEPNYEPTSIASQLSTQPAPAQYTDAPQVSIAREVPDSNNAPKSLMDHYIKIYGSPERARDAMAKVGQYQQSQIQ